MTHRAITRIVLVAAVLLATLLPTEMARAATDTTAEQSFAQRINQERTSRGLPALRVCRDLTTVARDHSKVMAAKNLLHHNPSLGSVVTNWARLAENVGRGSSVTSLHDALMNSAGHRANILDSQVSEVGVGVEVADGRMWVTEVFRRPRSGSCTALSSSSTSVPTGKRMVALSGDWDGDGRDTPGWWVDGTFYLSNRLDGTVARSFSYGRSTDVPVTGDWDGNGRDSVGVVRGSNWYLTNGLPGSTKYRFDYGSVANGDRPLVGDWNGDRRDTIGIIRDGAWHLRNRLSGGRGQIVFSYGRMSRGDRPVVGDWNRNGRDTIGIVRDGTWHLKNSLRGGNADRSFKFGRARDRVVTGDWNRSGGDTPGVVRSRTWYLHNHLSAGSASFSFEM